MRSLKDQFVDWVREQPPEAEYNYFANGCCAFARFLDAHGIARDGGVGGTYWTDAAGTDHEIAEPLAIALSQEPFTFGALASRLSPNPTGRG